MKLKTYVMNELSTIGSTLDAFPWELKEAYCSWIEQTYFFARETTTLLTLAAAKSERNSKLQLRFIAHAADEKGHEKLLEMDMRGLGNDGPSMTPFTSTSALFQSQYYWLYQAEPKAFFGYILLLEGIGSIFGKTIYERALRSHGREASYFAKVHSDDDVAHFEQALDEVEKFDSAVVEDIITNFAHCKQFYLNMLSEISSQQNAPFATVA